MKLSDSVRSSIIRGAMFIAPLWLTIVLAGMGYNLVENSAFGDLVAQVVRWLSPGGFLGGRFADGRVPGLSLLLAFITLGAIGFVASWHFGRQGLKLFDRLFLALPGLRVVYAGVRKVIDTVAESGKNRFQKVVFVSYPTPDTKTVAFVTNEVVCENGEKRYVLFVPMMPNPTSGFVLIMPASKVTETNMTPEEGLQFGISLGVLTPSSVQLDKI